MALRMDIYLHQLVLMLVFSLASFMNNHTSIKNEWMKNYFLTRKYSLYIYIYIYIRKEAYVYINMGKRMYIYIYIYTCVCGPGSNGNDIVFHIPQIYKFGASPSDAISRTLVEDRGLIPLKILFIHIYIYIYISCRAAMTDYPDPLSLPEFTVHRSRQVFQATSCTGTEMLWISSSWSSYLCSSMWVSYLGIRSYFSSSVPHIWFV